MSSVIDNDAISRLKRPIDKAYGLPGRAFTDPDHFAEEQKKIFQKGWVCAGHATDIPDPGDVQPVEIGGVPIILVRGRDKQIRAFHNICRHKGNLLVSEVKKKQRSIVCGYHCWAYDLTGRLKATPNFGGLGKEWEGTCRKKEEMGLFPVRLYDWHGWLFVNLEKDAPDFETHATGMIEAFNGYDFSELRLVEESRFVFQANWKLTFENFFDNYHVPYIHSESLKARNRELYESGTKLDESVRKYHNKGPFMAIEHNYPPGSSDAVLGMPVPEGMSDAWRSRIIYLHFFPNVLFFAQSDQFVGIIETPVAPDESHQRVLVFMHGDEAFSDDLAMNRKSCVDFWNTVNEEDVDICGTLQKGRRSPAFDGGIFAPAWEKQIHAYQQLIADYMTR